MYYLDMYDYKLKDRFLHGGHVKTTRWMLWHHQRR